MLWQSALFLTWLCSLFPHAHSSDLVVKNLPGRTSAETIQEIRRRLSDIEKRSDTNVLLDNSKSFALGFDNKKLFEYQFEHEAPGGNGTISSSIDITCTKCYIRGEVSAKLTANGSFNVSQAVEGAKNGFENTWDEITAYAENVTDRFFESIFDSHITEIIQDIKQLPPPNIDFNVQLDFPEYNLEVDLKDLELYVELSTVLSAGLTYTFTIFKSETLYGIEIGDDLLLGAVFSIDLILSADSQIEISNGFHVIFDDVWTRIVLFGKEASEIRFHGSKFEFLPVTIQSGDTILKAILRLELRIGFSFTVFASSLHLPKTNSSLNALNIGAGVEARVYANIAEFDTNITLGDVNLGKRDKDCALHITQGYKFAIGAAAGASLELFGNTWGPTPETEIPIFYTALAEACAVTGAVVAAAAVSSSQTPVPIGGREPLLTISTITTVTYTATVCSLSSMINCPASLQRVTMNVATRTLTTSIASGSAVVWSTDGASNFDTVDFQSNAITMTASSGKPKSYVPPPSPSSPSSLPPPYSTESVLNKEAEGVSNKVIIGVSVGLGVPALLAIVGGFIFYMTQKRKVPSSSVSPAPINGVDVKNQPITINYTPVNAEDN